MLVAPSVQHTQQDLRSHCQRKRDLGVTVYNSAAISQVQYLASEWSTLYRSRVDMGSEFTVYASVCGQFWIHCVHEHLQ
jgi:hypothetical protein